MWLVKLCFKCESLIEFYPFVEVGQIEFLQKMVFWLRDRNQQFTSSISETWKQTQNSILINKFDENLDNQQLQMKMVTYLFADKVACSMR